MPDNTIKLQFWGVRGSIPTPGSHTIRYGGNTPCVSVHFPNDEILIFDAGTGIRQFGMFYQNHRINKSLHIFISHYHWDHIQGLPFFSLLRNPEYEIHIYGCEEPNNHISTIISRQMESTYFPVELTDLAADIQFHSLTEGTYSISEILLQTFFINHPGYALGYRLEYEGKSIVYISDNEPFPTEETHSLIKSRQVPKQFKLNESSIEDVFDEYHEDKNQLLVEKIKDCDILIHDAQFFPAEYNSHQLWGHSPFTFPIQIAKQGHVKKLILFHHDPNHDDDILDRLYKEALSYAKSIDYSGEITMAREMDMHLL